MAQLSFGLHGNIEEITPKIKFKEGKSKKATLLPPITEVLELANFSGIPIEGMKGLSIKEMKKLKENMYIRTIEGRIVKVDEVHENFVKVTLMQKRARGTVRILNTSIIGYSDYLSDLLRPGDILHIRGEYFVGSCVFVDNIKKKNDVFITVKKDGKTYIENENTIFLISTKTANLHGIANNNVKSSRLVE